MDSNGNGGSLPAPSALRQVPPKAEKVDIPEAALLKKLSAKFRTWAGLTKQVAESLEESFPQMSREMMMSHWTWMKAAEVIDEGRGKTETGESCVDGATDTVSALLKLIAIKEGNGDSEH